MTSGENPRGETPDFFEFLRIIHRFGTVAIFATLFAAIEVKGDKGCVFDFEQVSDIDLECNNVKRSWVVNDDAKLSPNKKVLILSPDHDGCLKTQNTVILNSTTPVALRFFRDGSKGENEKLIMRLIPKEGKCPDEECMWDVTGDAQYKDGVWVTAEYNFPLKSTAEYFVQLQVDKNKGRLLVDRITMPTAYGSPSRCPSLEDTVRAAEEAGMNINLPSQLIAAEGNSTSLSPGFGEISKNLMLTSASVLALNNLLN